MIDAMIKGKVIAAPMAGISNRVFRDICREHGADMAYGEMVSARALHYDNRRTLELLDIENEATPKIVQLTASDPEYLAEAAIQVAEMGADIIDLNMGCPVPKVIRNNEGSSLMRDPRLAESLVKAARKSMLPVSVKIRSGWDEDSINAVEFAKRLEAAGAAFVAVHGRTRMQMYMGRADRSIIAAVKRAVRIPVIGNGDIQCGQDAVDMLAETGCDAVMVGRAMIGNPWLFAEIQVALSGSEPLVRPSVKVVVEQALEHLYRQKQSAVYWACVRFGNNSEEVLQEGELAAVRSMRCQLGWYIKGLRGAAALRGKLNTLTTVAQVEQELAEYLSANT